MSFALLLARTLGRTLHELGQTVTAYEYGLWLAEYRARPWGDLRLDLNIGRVVHSVQNMAGKVLKEPSKLEDCVLRFTADEHPAESDQESVDTVQTLKQMFARPPEARNS